ncbi:DUF2489 domain-containing protein [Atopomonas sediminilitoris]|uniref:DUF2489 domain-containing protein n=1 Tax=Atopomonas sediminilitoris TaxID=2919919 RepID=UPI001F4D548E|nr:DUF2489 domain-containing protein [Atopomonas sediminilitoris]MCJ8170122.1 DUF2489 domain-containing protein [Atopomonas sediminilitoris]
MAVNLLWWLAGALVIAALAGYALWLWRRVWAQQKAQQKQVTEQQHVVSQDLRFLAESLLNGQLPFIEGCLRIKVLLDHHSPDASLNADWAVFQQVYAATAHIPTHAAWKALSKNERRAFEQVFSQLEQQHLEAAKRAAQTLLQQH